MSHLESQKVPPLRSECLTRGDKVTHNNKDYNKTNKHTNIHTTTCALTREEITEAKDRFAEEGNTGAKASLEKDRVIGEKNSFHRKRSPIPDHYRVVNRRLRHSAPLTRVRGTSLEKTLINRFFFTHPKGGG